MIFDVGAFGAFIFADCFDVVAFGESVFADCFDVDVFGEFGSTPLTINTILCKPKF